MIKHKLFDLLDQRSKRNTSEYKSDRSIPSLEIPGRLAMLLDDLLEISEAKLNRSPGKTLTEVVDLGIWAWYEKLDKKLLAELELIEPEKFDESDEDGDPSPAAAQHQADAYAQSMGTVGYTPMTGHGLASKGKGGQDGNAGRRQQSRNRPASSSKRRRRGRGRRAP
jgi:hypothetical protein